MRRTIGIGLLVLLGATARAAPDDLDELLHLLGERHHGHVDFVEQHFLALLSRPVESSGELFYDAPDRLEKRTLEPRPESLMLAGDVLSIRRGRHRHVLDLKAYPQILPFVESIRATLAGDRAALERTFRVEYAGNLERWTLLLVPRESQIAATVSQVLIDGSGNHLRHVEIRQRDGDRSLMTLRDHSGP
ncbi:MAG TPA: LolA-related protein [Candidatus Binataceae bacterium]|nr:LolA-related protein [Candidatus Binataceae bacterium]